MEWSRKKLSVLLQQQQKVDSLFASILRIWIELVVFDLINECEWMEMNGNEWDWQPEDSILNVWICTHGKKWNDPTKNKIWMQNASNGSREDRKPKIEKQKERKKKKQATGKHRSIHYSCGTRFKSTCSLSLTVAYLTIQNLYLNWLNIHSQQIVHTIQ